MRPALAIVLAVTAAACRCGGGVTPAEGEVRVEPAALDFGQVYVGTVGRASLTLTNTGRAALAARLSVTPPFSVDPLVDVPGGQAVAVEVRFEPAAAGAASATLHAGPADVALTALGAEVPACPPSGACVTAGFDLALRQCVEVPRPDGAACSTACVSQGACTGGACAGLERNCADGDPCTVDACGEATGCVHPPRQCAQPSNPCLASSCVADAGCVSSQVADGTLCGDDDCAANSLPVCIAGQCVWRQRPQQPGACPQGWMRASVAPGAYAMAFDAAHARVVMFGGSIAGSTAGEDTWVWNGAAWVQRFPGVRPSPRNGHVLAYDELRQRVVLFGGNGGGTLLSDTWEWDGATWTRAGLGGPPARKWSALAWDGNRQRVVLFGGQGAGLAPLGDTWEWDGAAWTQRTTPLAPPARIGPAMAWDSVRRRVVLFGGKGAGYLADTWDWDGARWMLRQPATSPPARESHALAFDGARGRLVLFGGLGPATGDDTWEWDGTTWLERHPPAVPAGRHVHALAWDAVRQRTVLFGGADALNVVGLLSDTWEWNGDDWQERSPTAPRGRWDHAMAFDEARGQVVLTGGHDVWRAYADGWAWTGTWAALGGSPARAWIRDELAWDGAGGQVLLLGDGTWALDGGSWSRLAPPAEPPPRKFAATAWDPARRRVVLFGGQADDGGVLDDTWEWDGARWAQAAPAASPPARLAHAMTWDPAGGRVLLFGGATLQARLADTWAWDGAAWAALAPAARPAARWFHALATDPVRARVLLFGGVDGTTSFGDTWEWNGVTWSQPPVSNAPGPRGSHAMAFDPLRRRVVLFGGTGAQGGEYGDTWVYNAPP